MTSSAPNRLDQALAALPRAYQGPGGAVAVLREGEVLVRHAWGFANIERRIPFTTRTLFRICSIGKQFTCALVLDAFSDPSVLDQDVRARLPLLDCPAPGALHLCHNQSGLRDYWALAMLHGALAESPFGAAEAARVIGGARSTQFRPGERYSYANQNFRLLSEILEQRAGRSYAELLRRRLFDRVGMESAFLAADTRSMPDGAEGYEGDVERGFRPAKNRILWTGDTGIGASLDDMIAWERHIDRTRDDPDALYSRLSWPVTFASGDPAAYGFGLARGEAMGRPITGHGGALRGWRSYRLYCPFERISVVVMFNHLGDANGAAVDLFAAALNEDRAALPGGGAAPPLVGAYLEPETGLAARIEPAAEGKVRLRFGHSAEVFDANEDGAVSAAGRASLRPAEEGGVWMDRPNENQRTLLRPSVGAAALDVAGRYRCEELNAELTVVDAGGVLHGALSGFLGQGRMERLEPIGPDLWALPCPRALDHTPPGDWTLAFGRDEAGAPASVTVGCWLARGLRYLRL